MNRTTKCCLAAIWVVAASTGAQAQSLRDFEAGRANDMRATASVTVPLGARSTRGEAKPRLDFTLVRQISGLPDDATPLRLDHEYQPRSFRLSTVSLTLENNPRLLMNDHQVATFGPRLTADEDDKSSGLGTGGWILLGTAAAIGAGFLIGEIVKDDIEDAIRGN